ncbi:MAG: dolichyl-phosphate-mannose--protein mannosyltransferase [Candidatus Nanopelagicales bacterium]
MERIGLFLRGWWVSLTLGLISAGLRLPNLSQPPKLIFDETYYAKDAWALLQNGYESKYVENADSLIVNGDTDVLLTDPTFIVHPPVGKWLIAFGEAVYGFNPFGWRIVAALVGIAMVILIHRIALRLFSHQLTSFLAALFFAIDGMAIVHSRVALLDQFVTFFLLLAFACLLIDRDSLYRKLNSNESLSRLRPWLIGAVIFAALAVSTKWSALWFAPLFAVFIVFYGMRVRMRLGNLNFWKQIWKDDILPLLPVALFLVPSIYLLSWAGWFLSDNAWMRNAQSDTFLPDALQNLIDYHIAMWNFHVNLTVAHSYSANPWTWPLQIRPTSFFFESYSAGKNGCESGTCAAEVLALGNPLIWWAGTLALIHQLWRVIRYVDGRSVSILGFFLAGWLPWLFFQERTVFGFYTIILLPAIVLALAYSLSLMLGSPYQSRLGRARAALSVGTVVAVSVTLSIFFYPIWVGETISYTYWQVHMWFSSWI